MTDAKRLEELEDMIALELGKAIDDIITKYTGEDYKCEIGVDDKMRLVINVLPREKE